MFDVYKTLVDCPGWNQFKAENAEIAALEQKWLANRARYQNQFMATFDLAVERGQVIAFPYDEVRRVLGQFYGRGHIGVYSSGSSRSIGVMLETSGLQDFITDRRLILSTADDLKVAAKDTPEAFQVLDRYLRENGFAMKSYVDDSEKIVSAAKASGVEIARLYHMDRTILGLGGSGQREGYSVISSLDGML